MLRFLQSFEAAIGFASVATKLVSGRHDTVPNPHVKGKWHSPNQRRASFRNDTPYDCLSKLPSLSDNAVTETALQISVRDTDVVEDALSNI
jgi:hypothetical protein